MTYISEQDLKSFMLENGVANERSVNDFPEEVKDLLVEHVMFVTDEPHEILVEALDESDIKAVPWSSDKKTGQYITGAIYLYLESHLDKMIDDFDNNWWAE